MRSGVILVLLGFLCLSITAGARGSRVMRMEATAFAAPPSKPTSAGTVPHEGIVAADPSVLPLGSRIRVSGAGVYDGVYTVTDTGGKVVGRHIDLYLPTEAEARRFGKKIVRVRILQIGDGKAEARQEDIPAQRRAR